MKNLENYGVQELNAKEVQSVEGGFIWFLIALFAENFDSSVQPDGELGGYLGCKL